MKGPEIVAALKGTVNTTVLNNLAPQDKADIRRYSTESQQHVNHDHFICAWAVIMRKKWRNLLLLSSNYSLQTMRQRRSWAVLTHATNGTNSWSILFYYFFARNVSVPPFEYQQLGYAQMRIIMRSLDFWMEAALHKVLAVRTGQKQILCWLELPTHTKGFLKMDCCHAMR